MTDNDPTPINRLLDIMARLRDPEGGCPWDLAQDFDSIAPYTVEEAFEVAEAIANGDRDELRDELGDLLLQVVFHSQMAAEQGSFDFHDVAESISEKMLRRHPHVFGDAKADDGEAVKQHWEAIKAAERAEKGKEYKSALDGVPEGIPALQRAAKLQKKASKVGFDWDRPEEVVGQLHSELDELREAMADNDQEKIDEEFGDVLFTLVNLSRHLNIDAEQSLRRAGGKFRRRFTHMETQAEQSGRTIRDFDRDQLEVLWQNAKRR
jgi:ATP diphosphatase